MGLSRSFETCLRVRGEFLEVLVLWRISRRFRRVRASPLEVSMRNFLAFGLSFRSGRFLRARVRMEESAGGSRGESVMTSERERRAELISKEGFSVVAPMSVR